MGTHTISITELIDELQDRLIQHGDIPVMSSSDYGDYSHTEQLENISSIECCIPEKTAYSRTGLEFPPENHEEDIKHEDPESILVLRYV